MLVVEVQVPGRARAVPCVTEDPTLDIGDRLLVEHGGRTAFGVVVRVPLALPWPEEAAPPGKVVRRARQVDEEREAHIQRRREDWFQVARQKVAEHGLPMRILRADPSPSGKRVTFQFVAEGRVDFRALVRDLARTLNARVELRQIGARDAALLQGGVGHCGQELCCARWLPGFSSVSMKMAKAQGLPLNPAKISGRCGRLMCCLRFELDDPDAVRGKGARGGRGQQRPQQVRSTAPASPPQEKERRG